MRDVFHELGRHRDVQRLGQLGHDRVHLQLGLLQVGRLRLDPDLRGLLHLQRGLLHLNSLLGHDQPGLHNLCVPGGCRWILLPGHRNERVRSGVRWHQRGRQVLPGWCEPAHNLRCVRRGGLGLADRDVRLLVQRECGLRVQGRLQPVERGARLWLMRSMHVRHQLRARGRLVVLDLLGLQRWQLCRHSLHGLGEHRVLGLQGVRLVDDDQHRHVVQRRDHVRHDRVPVRRGLPAERCKCRGRAARVHGLRGKGVLSRGRPVVLHLPGGHHLRGEQDHGLPDGRLRWRLRHGHVLDGSNAAELGHLRYLRYLQLRLFYLDGLLGLDEQGLLGLQGVRLVDDDQHRHVVQRRNHVRHD